jgi:hypothetical protein
VNETIREIVALARNEMNKQRVTLRLELILLKKWGFSIDFSTAGSGRLV